jgi:hypothetical protein
VQASKVVALLAAGFLVVGCQSGTGGQPSDLPEDSGLTEGLPEEPVFIPERIEGGSARENQPHVDYLIEGAIGESTTRVAGRSIVELLVVEGYDSELMELTPDMSLIELPADSTSLALRFDQECLITQWGTDWYTSSVEPTVAGGRCLLGETVSLD